MKRLCVIVLTSLLLPLAGCSGTRTVDINVKSADGGTKAIAANADGAAAQPASAANSFSKTFDGTINDQYPIRMSLQRSGGELSGSYVYTKHNVDIPIKGTIDEQSNVVINEFDGKGNQTGVFKGRMSPEGKIEGTWSKPDGDKPMPFSLTESGGQAASAKATATPESTPANLDEQAVAAVRRQLESNLFTKCGDLYVMGVSDIIDQSGVYKYKDPKFVSLGSRPVTEADKLNGISWSGKVAFQYSARKASLYGVNNRITDTPWTNYQGDSAFTFDVVKSGSAWKFEAENPVRFRHFVKVSCQN